MQHRLAFGSLELPQDWEDHTTYQFVGPPGRDLGMPMAAGRGVAIGATRLSLTAARVRPPASLTLEAYLRQQVEELRRMLPGFTLHSIATWPHPTCGEVPAVDASFDLEAARRVRQVQLYLPAEEGKTLVRLTVSVAASQFDARKRELDELLAGFTPG